MTSEPLEVRRVFTTCDGHCRERDTTVNPWTSPSNDSNDSVAVATDRTNAAIERALALFVLILEIFTIIFESVACIIYPTMYVYYEDTGFATVVVCRLSFVFRRRRLIVNSTEGGE
jgi:hypothetical protein